MKTLLKALLHTVIAVHFLLVVTYTVAIVIILFKTPWYIALPLITSVYQLLTTRVSCPLTTLENMIRSRLEMDQIKGFIGHYFLGKA